MTDRKTVFLSIVALVSVSLSAAFFVIGTKPEAPVEVQNVDALLGNWTSEGGVGLESGEPGLVIVEFGDYECPACRSAAPLVEELLNEFPSVEFRFRQYVLPQHKLASDASPIAVLARQKGQFRACHELLMGGDKLTQEAIEAAIERFGLSVSERDIGQAMTVVAQDITAADALGVEAIPAIFVVSKGRGYRIKDPRQLRSFISDQLTSP